MTDDINAQPDYGDEPPFACSSVAVLDGEAFACGGTPGHAGKHRYLIDWNGQGDLAEPKPARELAADPFGVGAFTGHGPGCGCDECEGARSDAATDEPTPGPIYGGGA